MIVFSTVLQVNGQPTVYSVYKNGDTAFLNPSRPAQAPILLATMEEASWQVRGTDDEQLMLQVLQEIRD